MSDDREIPVLSEKDYLSLDGTMVFYKEELEALARRFPAIECVPALIARACKTWLRDIAPADRKRVLLEWFELREADGGFRKWRGRA